MTADLPYTDDDLRAEAARQHRTLTEDPDWVCTGERMEDGPIASHEGGAEGTARTWLEVLGDEGDYTGAFESAQRTVHDLITGAADLSEWAIQLGADGLEPLDEQVTAHADGAPWFRLHFAVRPDMPDDLRRALVEGIGAEIAKHFSSRTDTP